MQVSLSDEAIVDADDAVDWYIGEGDPAAADDFLNEVDHALDLLLNNPEMGRNSSHQTRILPCIVFRSPLSTDHSRIHSA